MDAQLLAQPFRSQSSAHEFLTRALADPDIDSFLMCTAWVRSSGIDRLATSLENLRSRGGRAEAVIGVDYRGSSRQGLREALRVFDRVDVVKDVEGRTFHPKLYVARGPKKAHLLVGSNNLTGGGLFFNYEAAMACTLGASRSDVAILAQIDEYVADLRSDKAICIRLNSKKLGSLVRSRMLEDERSARQHHAREDELRKGAKRSGLFTRSQRAKRAAPPFERRDPLKRASKKRRGQPRAPKPFVARKLGPDSWWKKLGRGEAQRLSPGGHSTGAIRITRPAGTELDPGDFFRRQLFDTASWQRARDAHGNRVLASIRQ